MVEYSCGFVGLRKEGEMDDSPHVSIYSFFTSVLSQMSDIDSKNIFQGIPSLNLLTSCIHVS